MLRKNVYFMLLESSWECFISVQMSPNSKSKLMDQTIADVLIRLAPAEDEEELFALAQMNSSVESPPIASKNAANKNNNKSFREMQEDAAKFWRKGRIPKRRDRMPREHSGDTDDEADALGDEQYEERMERLEFLRTTRSGRIPKRVERTLPTPIPKRKTVQLRVEPDKTGGTPKFSPYQPGASKEVKIFGASFFPLQGYFYQNWSFV